MSAALRWLKISQLLGGAFASVEAVELDGEQMRELVRTSQGTARVGGKLTHIVHDKGGHTEHYVLDERPEREPRTAAASPIAANTAVRLREIADLVECLDIPATCFPAITVAFDDVNPAVATELAAKAAAAYYDSRQVQSPARSAASWYGNPHVPPVVIEFLHPGPSSGYYCEGCGATEPGGDFDDLRRPAHPAGVATAPDPTSEVTP